MKMKSLLTYLTAFGLIVMLSCEVDEPMSNDQVSDATLSQISRLGFSTQNVIRADGGYIVEGDIFLRPQDLTSTPASQTLRIAEVEQYRTTNLVTGLPRNITVSSSGSVNANVSAGIDAAIARYNAENLQITMERVASGGNINVRIVNGGGYIASAGFPSGGDPYNTVKFNKQYQNYSLGFVTTVMAHEIGHCVGFRHTDYMDRSFSCGGSPSNEGASTVGAIHIPGTPEGPDSASWMLACLSSTTNRPFNNNDKTALNYIY